VTLNVFLKLLPLGLLTACAAAPPAQAPEVFVVPPSKPAPVDVAPDLRKEISALGIRECDDYVAAFEQACFEARGATLPAPLGELLEHELHGFREKGTTPAGREALKRGCASGREALRTFQCRAF
jgi:hypothetical protein